MLPPVWNYPFTYRAVKGSPLSNDEVDDNFKAVAERAEYAQTVAETLPNEIALTAADAATYAANQIASAALTAAQAAAADAAAVVTGGTATLTPEAGKIPLAGASGYIDNGWINPTWINSAGGAVGSLIFSRDTAAEARGDLELGDSAVRDVGTAGSTVAAGDDSRFASAARSAEWDSVSDKPIVQTTGVSTGNIMSQKAVTDAIASIPSVPKSAAYTAVAADKGKSIDTGAGVTIPAGVFSVGDVLVITNTSAVPFNISPASGVTIRLAGSDSTGVRELGEYGVATLRMASNNVWFASGAGLI